MLSTSIYSVTTLEFGAFESNALTSVIIPDSVTTILAYAFDNNSLTSVTIPDGVTFIEGYAFRNNALSGAAFVDNFGDFRLDMFNENPTLATITYCEGAMGWPQTFNIGNFASPVGITKTSTVYAAPTTPVPVGPLWLLGIMAGLMSLLGIRKLRKG